MTLENRGHHLAEAAAELRQDDGLARRLGAAGAALVANALAPRMVQVSDKRQCSILVGRMLLAVAVARASKLQPTGA